MKKTIFYILLSLSLAFGICGCKCTGGNCGKDKPVAPETFSSEHGDKDDPVLPPMNLWWK